jgi:hypothetical protein
MSRVWVLMRNDEIATDDEGYGPTYIVASKPVHVYKHEGHAMEAMSNANERVESANEDLGERAYYTVEPVTFTDYHAYVTVPHG